LGQWLYGRIYERRCDLAPDGEHLIYFAMNGQWQSKVKGAWTAISRAPYLKAVTLYAKGDCWHGGGLFGSSAEYWLNDGYGHQRLQEDKHLRRVTRYPWHESYGGECLGVYYIRLQRDGWVMKETIRDKSGDHLTVFEKPARNHWVLRKRAHATTNHPVGRGVYYDTHELFNTKTGEAVELEPWEWADVDDRWLLWAAEGCIYRGRVGVHGLHGAKLLYDARPLRFERIKAPY
jgi:hypothetical protein